jgi:hypothetical protein
VHFDGLDALLLAFYDALSQSAGCAEEAVLADLTGRQPFDLAGLDMT